MSDESIASLANMPAIDSGLNTPVDARVANDGPGHGMRATEQTASGTWTSNPTRPKSAQGAPAP